MKKYMVILKLKDGEITPIYLAENVTVKIHDYDIAGYPVEGLEPDASGDMYHEIDL